MIKYEKLEGIPGVEIHLVQSVRMVTEYYVRLAPNITGASIFEKIVKVLNSGCFRPYKAKRLNNNTYELCMF